MKRRSFFAAFAGAALAIKAKLAGKSEVLATASSSPRDTAVTFPIHTTGLAGQLEEMLAAYPRSARDNLVFLADVESFHRLEAEWFVGPGHGFNSMYFEGIPILAHNYAPPDTVYLVNRDSFYFDHGAHTHSLQW